MLGIGIHAAAKQCEVRMLICGVDQALQPVWLSDGVRIQQRDEGRVIRFPDGQVVASRKPQVVRTANDRNPGKCGFQIVCRAVGAGVVDDDGSKIPEGLPGQ